MLFQLLEIAYSMPVVDNQRQTNPNQYQMQPPSQPETRFSEPKKEGTRSVIATFALFLLAPVIAILLTMFVFQSYEVDGPSMETTLYNQDRLIVYKLPVTWSNIINNDYVPDRDDIIVFTKVSGNGFGGEDKQLIKRIIGLPGDQVVIKNGDVTIYNTENPNGFNPDKDADYMQGMRSTQGNVDITVKEDEVFVLGDNRNNSLDSRAFGPIKQEDIVGTLVMRLWPFNTVETF